MTRGLVVRMTLRSFFVQSSWNFQRMQSLGFFFLVYPALLRRYGRGSVELQEASRRHLELFNTHPYFAGLVAGTVAREELECGERGLAEALKRSLMCTLGGLGDDLFWAHLRPLAALLALPFALAGHPAASLVLLAVFNVPHLAVRFWGVGAGLARGRGVVDCLQSWPFARAVPAMGSLLVIIAGALVGGFAARGDWGLLPGGGVVSAALGGGAFLALVLLQIRGTAPNRIIVSATVLAVVAGAVRVVTTP